MNLYDLQDYAGIYHATAGVRQILVIANSERLTYLEPATGHYRVLSLVKEDTFTAGSGFKQATPVEVVALFQRDLEGKITQVIWKQNDQEQVLTRKGTFRYEDVMFHNIGVNLAGRLTFPSAVGAYPAIVMLHGSGAQNRYEFQPLAEYFASLGIVALTYDKRGVDHSSGQWQTATYQDLAEDALAGLRYLQSRSDINHKEIGMWGISQGGWLTLIAAAHSTDVAFIIPVSCPGVNPIRQELWRIEHVLQAEGFPSEDIETAIELTKQGVSFWQDRNDNWDEFILSLEKVKEKTWFSYLGFGINSTKEEAEYEATRLIEPAEILQQISCPILAIFGELDPYLPVGESTRQFRETLAGNKHHDYEVKVIPKGNHVLFNTITGSISEQPRLPGYVPDYLRIIRTWLLRHLKNRLLIPSGVTDPNTRPRLSTQHTPPADPPHG